jgi:N-acetylglucosamine malate deacetylase 2
LTPAAQRLLLRLGGGESAAPRTMLVGAHPDDETVGAGSRLERLRDARFVCVTDGAPRDGRDASRHGLTPEAYAVRRRAELEAALALCGIPATQLTMLGSPDQQASLHMVPLARRLAELLAQHDIEAVLTHPYEGGHPDHDATAFIVHAAAALVHQGGGAAPAILEWTSYHRGPDGVLTNEFLPAPRHEPFSVAVALGQAEQDRKAALLACHATQRETLSHLPMYVERFRPAPAYDFTQPPHAWKLHYEQFPWGMTGERFRELAARALTELGLEVPL